MAGTRVSPFRAILNYMRRNKILSKEGINEKVGIDQQGNTYYWRRKNPELNVKEARFVVPPENDQDPDMIPLAKKVPPEWDAWLRGRRANPPTLEEMKQIELEKLKMQQKVRELEMKERMELRGSSETEEQAVANKPEFAKTIEGDTNKKAFPTYDDYEIHPGEFVEKKKN